MAMILKDDEKLTEIAKNIFGDIAVKAFYSTEFYGHLKEEQMLKYIDDDINESTHSDNVIDIDEKTIVVEFSNGKKVAFFSSEWGSIESVHEHQVIRII